MLTLNGGKPSSSSRSSASRFISWILPVSVREFTRQRCEHQTRAPGSSHRVVSRVSIERILVRGSRGAGRNRQEFLLLEIMLWARAVIASSELLPLPLLVLLLALVPRPRTASTRLSEDWLTTGWLPWL